MKKYFIFIFIICSILISPLDVFAVTDSGFIKGQIWYSEEPLVEGKTVNIYTSIWNGKKNSILVKVEFYDKNIILGRREVTIAPSELKDVSISWKVTSGDHVISAKIASSTEVISGKEREVLLDNTTTSNDRISVSTANKSATDPLLDTSKLEDKLKNTGSKINEFLPEKVNNFISNTITKIESFREKISTKIEVNKDEAQAELELIKSKEKPILERVQDKSKTEDNTRRPIVYVKLFMFSAFSFIFANKIVFYGLSILIILSIIRRTYRKIKSK
jgi:hypothetical protein